jgi:hypothetical protein
MSCLLACFCCLLDPFTTPVCLKPGLLLFLLPVLLLLLQLWSVPRQTTV